MNIDERTAQAKGIYAKGLERVRTAPEPNKQRFPCGARVRIAAVLERSMSHYPAGANATVEYTYAHAYGGTDVDNYSLNVDGQGSVAWYHPHQLKLIGG